MQSSREDLSFTSEISFAGGDFVDLGMHKTQIGVLPLVHIRRGIIRPLGTCFSVTNDGLCMTARHVIEEGVQIAKGIRHLDLNDEMGTFGALYISSEPVIEAPGDINGGLLQIENVYMCDSLDIALVKLGLPVERATGKPIRFPAHQLRLSFPGVGEPFFGLGYRTMDWRRHDDNEGHSVEQTYSATRGHVEELHAGGRDAAMLPFPCFRTSARLDGGMSGGPLIDHLGRVFGVVCSSFAASAEDDGHVSYGSLVGPAMAMTLDVCDVPEGQKRRAFMWELVEGGAVSAYRGGISARRAEGQLTLMFGQTLTLEAQLDG